MPVRGRQDAKQTRKTVAILAVVALFVFLVPWRGRTKAVPPYATEEAPKADGYLPQGISDAVERMVASMVRDNPKNYPGAGPEMMHGPVGLTAEGKELYQYSPNPGPIVDEDAALKDNGFYTKLSDSISLDRPVADSRDPLCKAVPEDDLMSLPDTTVIFVFYNEALSTLLRSIHSVLNRTPPQLLKEIWLIDDGSDRPHLMQELEDHVKLLPKVQLHRQPKRMGLVKARLKGAELATAETFTVLDSHIEVQPGWLEPLMRRMKDSPTRVMMPMIDSIDPRTFRPNAGGIGCSLGFLWQLTEHSIDIQPKDEARRTSPIDYIRSPAMAGGLFTFNREYFWKLGGYDEDFSFWGTENLEISFRIWQCGGTLECSPCSRVYHAFRGHHPYTLPANSITKNKLRTAAIWMDEYAFITQNALGNQKIDIGPLDKMMALRKRLECKPFSWYMDEVYPTNIFKNPTEIAAISEVKNVASNYCLDTLGNNNYGQTFGIYQCHGAGGSQTFVYMRSHRQLRPLANLEVCMHESLQFGRCDEQAEWEYTKKGFLLHAKTAKCLAVSDEVGGRHILKMASCSDSSVKLEWKMEFRHKRPQLARNPLKNEKKPPAAII